MSVDVHYGILGMSINYDPEFVSDITLYLKYIQTSVPGRLHHPCLGGSSVNIYLQSFEL